MTASANPTAASPSAGMASARCPRCQRRFDCGRRAEPFDCWCKTLPALPAGQVDPRGRCLCPECLAASVAGGHAAGLETTGEN